MATFKASFPQSFDIIHGKAMTATKVEAVRKTKGKGKQPKVFVEDKGIALELAQTIADKQEDKSKERADKRHVQVAAHRPSQKPRASSKTKLVNTAVMLLSISADLSHQKEVKTALKAEKARVKKGEGEGTEAKTQGE
ncbi:hypothetical protein NM688_g3679 [Phlebia brevispora]|uniref:Uncharacterized protein n=1 Tax=Phlebia brevispora TaxID=194682 RepID=A0ACC1T522_9APHY|nr:hypothetical protein NM688_g3679 [Phlebia brevispora]